VRDLLWCALGGGLGHLSRARALFAAAPELAARTTLLASSDLWPTIDLPCPVVVVPHAVRGRRRDWMGWVGAVLEEHSPRALVLDAFPDGMLGEWRELAPALPRLHLARRLQWDRYLEKAGRGASRLESLILEPLEPLHREHLESRGTFHCLEAPLVHPERENVPVSGTRKVVAHSGPLGEQEELSRLSGIALDPSAPDVEFFPDRASLASLAAIASGCGYNTAAESFADLSGRRRVLHPFPRPLDDQFARHAFLEAGGWPLRQGGARLAARWMLERLPAALD